MKTIGIDISPLNNKQKTGIGVYTFELIKALLEINKQDQFVLFGISTFETRNYFKNIEYKKYSNVRLAIYTIPARAFRTTFLLWQTLNWPAIEKLVGPVDIFHNFNWYFPPQKQGKKVATVFDMTPVLYRLWHQKKTIQLDGVRLKRIKENADLVITISEHSKKDFLQFAPNKKAEVIYPGVAAQFSAKVNKNKLKEVLQKYDLEKDYFLSVATLEPRKNIRMLIEAFLESGLKNKLVLTGRKGWGSGEIFDLVKQYPDKIKITGFVEDGDLPYLYGGAICMVYPSFYEGFGIPVLEAMTSGVPVICSNTSSLPEVGGDAPLYIDPYSKDSLKKALISVFNNEDLRKTMIAKGLKQAKKFSWQKSARKLNEFYQNLLLK